MSRRREDKVRRSTSVIEVPIDGIESLLLRARKLRARGETRRALVVLRQACNLDEWRARSWTLLGAFLAEVGQRDEAVRAFTQARWLRARVGETGRAAVCARLADAVASRAA